MDTTKAEAAAYAPEIELLTRAMRQLDQTPAYSQEALAICWRLRVLLGLEEENK